jgi:hypothetical protein
MSKFLGGPSLVGGSRMNLVRLTCSCPDDPDLDTFLALRRASKPGHDGPMEPVRGEPSPSRREMHRALANKRAADSHALALLPTIRKLMAAGFVSQRGLANELNRRGIPAAGGGRWHRTAVTRMLTRLGHLVSAKGGTNNGLATKRVADVRAEALRPTIRKLRKVGFVSITAIARELNERGIPTARGGKWRLTTVTRLLERLERLEAFQAQSRHPDE